MKRRKAVCYIINKKNIHLRNQQEAEHVSNCTHVWRPVSGSGG